jgi:hypothetical protein
MKWASTENFYDENYNEVQSWKKNLN